VKFYFNASVINFRFSATALFSNTALPLTTMSGFIFATSPIFSFVTPPSMQKNISLPVFLDELRSFCARAAVSAYRVWRDTPG